MREGLKQRAEEDRAQAKAEAKAAAKRAAVLEAEAVAYVKRAAALEPEAVAYAERERGRAEAEKRAAEWQRLESAPRRDYEAEALARDKAWDAQEAEEARLNAEAKARDRAYRLAEEAKGHPSAKAFLKAQQASLKASEARRLLPSGSSRARITTANARWARAAEERDRLELEIPEIYRPVLRGMVEGN